MKTPLNPSSFIPPAAADRERQIQGLDSAVTDCVIAAVESTAPASSVISVTPNVTQDLFIRCAKCQAWNRPPNIEAVLTLPEHQRLAVHHPGVAMDLVVNVQDAAVLRDDALRDLVLTLPSREVIVWCRRCETAIFKVKGESSAGQGLMLLAVYEDEPT